MRDVRVHGIRCVARWDGERCPSRSAACAINKRGPYCFDCYDRIKGNIPIAQSPESCQIHPGQMADVYSLDELEARVAKMRALGVTKWGDIELGPDPTSAETDATQRMTAPDEKAQRAEVSRRAFAASGGPVKSAGRPQ